MATIKEDYVSFETAKLLKEKGFNESCYTYYDNIDDTINRFDKGYHFNNTSYPWGVPYDVNKAKKYVVAPTLQMTMKWLREVHGLHISLEPYYDYDSMHVVFLAFVQNVVDVHEFMDGRKNVASYPNAEKSCELAIKYCLEHLI